MAHLFSRSMGKYFVDVIITAMAAQIPIYQLALQMGSMPETSLALVLIRRL